MNSTELHTKTPFFVKAKQRESFVARQMITGGDLHVTVTFNSFFYWLTYAVYIATD
jgi:hypothetical protein